MSPTEFNNSGGEWFQLNTERLEPGAVGSLDAELVAESF